MDIRPERADDAAGIGDVIVRAFGRADEARLVAELREAGDAAISLVAVEGGAVIGHILLSPMAAPFRALALAPLAVAPERQKQGVGAALIKAANAQARREGWDAVFVLGDPAYYGRFGFRGDLAAGFESAFAGVHFMVLPLTEGLPATEGRLDYAPAFGNLT